MKKYKKAIILIILVLTLCMGAGIAVKIYIDLRGTIVYESLNYMEIQAFNSKFIEYEGIRTYNDVINLVDIINENNEKYKDKFRVELIIDGKEINDYSNKEIIELNKNYEIIIKYDNNNEFIKQIIINKIK